MPFPAEVLAASAVALILAGGLFYLSLYSGGAAGLRDWAVAVALLNLHGVMAYVWLAHDASRGASFVAVQAFHVVGSAFFLLGARRFCHRAPRFAAVWSAAGVAIVFVALGGSGALPSLWTAAAVHLVTAGLLVLGGVAVWASAENGRLRIAVGGLATTWALLSLVLAVAGAPLVPRQLHLIGGEVFSNLLAVTLFLMALHRHGAHLDEARRRAQDAALDAAEKVARLRRVLDGLADAVVTVDEKGIITDVNPAAEAIFGYSAAEVIGQEASVILPLRGAPHQPGGLVEHMAEELGDLDRHAQGDLTGLRRDGSPVPIDLTVRTVRLDSRKHHVALVRDVTDQRLKARLEAFLNGLDDVSLVGRGGEALWAEACNGLMTVFGVPLVAVAERVGKDGLVLRHVAGADDDPRVLEALERFLEDDAVVLPLVHSTAHCDDLPVVGDLPEPLDRYGWAVVLPLPAHGGQRGVLVLAGGTRRPSAEDVARMRMAATRIGAAHQVLRDQQQLRLQGAAIAAAANAIFVTDLSGRIEWVNEAFLRLSGYTAEEVIGKSPAILRSGAQDDSFYSRLWATILEGKVWRGEVVERRKDGRLYTVEQTVAPILDEEGNVAHFVAVHEDVTERKEAEQRVQYLANYDILTRLPNRVLFRDHLYEAVNVARNARSSLAVLFIDLDRFSRVNDTLGHEVGDQLLMIVASRINAAAAATAETVARIGGDEFAIIQKNLPNAEAAAALARKVIEAVKRPVDLDGLEVQVGANVGIAIFPQDGDDPDHLIKNADMAMYRAIRSESEEYFFFSNEMNDEARQRLGLEGDLRRALDNGELSLQFQPQISVAARRITGLEALLRWHHPSHGWIPPSQFTLVAEDSGLIVPIGEWVLQEALRHARRWHDMGLPPVTVALNISAVQFRDQHLVAKVRDAVAANAVDPRLLELELTESMLMQDAAEAVRILRELSAIGAQLAIDDFGTGYSSLSYLKQFPVDKLKLDKSFVRYLPDDANDAVIARATINLGHSLGLTVVAEGVETEAQFAYLRDEGCDIVQGFLFGRPMSAADIEARLRQEKEAAAGPETAAPLHDI